MTSSSAVCIISGGLDSVAFAFYLKEIKNLLPYTITFFYGQKSTEETKRARIFADLLKSKAHMEVDISFLKNLYGDTNVLTGSGCDIPGKFNQSMVVPYRNAIFLTISAAWTARLNVDVIAYGAHADDQNYPDCRQRFVSSIENMLCESDLDASTLGLRKRLEIWCPAKEGIHKKDLARIGYELLGDKVFSTWSCYHDEQRNREDIPIHCGLCESCVNRKATFNAANIEDKTEYAT